MDVDIDCPPGFKPLELFRRWVKASRVEDGELLAHPVGVHPQRIPVDPVTKCAAIPFKEAEALGYAKIDFLTLHFYKLIKDRAEIDELLRIEPDWSLLLVPSNQVKLFQLSKHCGLINELRPRNVLQVADLMALIRPGKMALLGLYKNNRANGRKLLFAEGDEFGYRFKKSHALAYSYVVWLQLHLIEQKRL